MKKINKILEQQKSIFSELYQLSEQRNDLMRKQWDHGWNGLSEEEKDLFWNLDDIMQELHDQQVILRKQYRSELCKSED